MQMEPISAPKVKTTLKTTATNTNSRFGRDLVRSCDKARSSVSVKTEPISNINDVKSDASSENIDFRSAVGSVKNGVRLDPGPKSSLVKSEVVSLRSESTDFDGLKETNENIMLTDLKRSLRAVLVTSKDGILANRLQGKLMLNGHGANYYEKCKKVMH